jgi:hypothetical protein
VRIVISEQTFEIRLSWWQRVFGLLRNISVPRADISAVEVFDEPLSETAGSGLKVGIRLPGYYYVARTIRLDHVFIVRRGIPALSFAVHNDGVLTRVLVSSPEAKQLAEQLSGS